MTSNISHLVLGTAQLGLSYGVNNRTGKPSREDAYMLLDAAFTGGVQTLDTAAVYGDAEQLIGTYIAESGHPFKVCTKMDSTVVQGHTGKALNQAVTRAIWQAAKNLCGSPIECFYLHDYHLCAYPEVTDALKQARLAGHIQYAGVSIYHPWQLQKIIAQHLDTFNVVQVPLNPFSGHIWRPLLGSLPSTLQLYIRSIFLQGLVFMHPYSLFVKKLAAERYVSTIQTLARKNMVAVAQLCYNYVASFSGVSGIVVGCETKTQLEENLACCAAMSPLAPKTLVDIEAAMAGIDENVYNPVLWKEQ